MIITKLRRFAPVFLALALLVFIGASLSTKEAKADDGILDIDVQKSVDNVTCATTGDSTTTEVQGTYTIENESAVPIILSQIRDWVSIFPFDDQPIGGSYALMITDGGSFATPIMVYDVLPGGVGGLNPPFQALNYGPIAPGQTVVLFYTLVYQGVLPIESYNSVNFTVSGICDPACELAIAYDQVMFSGAPVCQIVQVEVSPAAEVNEENPVPIPTESPQVLGQAQELPQAGASQSWFYYLVIPGILAATFSLRLLLKKFN